MSEICNRNEEDFQVMHCEAARIGLGTWKPACRKNFAAKVYEFGAKAPLPEGFHKRVIRILTLGCYAVIAGQQIDYYYRYLDHVAQLISHHGLFWESRIWCAVLECYWHLYQDQHWERVARHNWYAPEDYAEDPKSFLPESTLLKFAQAVARERLRKTSIMDRSDGALEMFKKDLVLSPQDADVMQLIDLIGVIDWS